MDNISFAFLTIICFILLIIALYFINSWNFYSFFKAKQDFKDREILNNNVTKEKNNGKK